MNKNTYLMGVSLTLLAACSQIPTQRPTQNHQTNLLELKFTNLNTEQPQSEAQSLVSTPNGIQRQAFTQIQSGLTFQTLQTQTARDKTANKRLLQGVYRVTNNTGRDLKYLTFVPVNTDDTDGNATNNAMTPTFGSTALTSLKYFDGSDASIKASTVNLGQGQKIDLKTGQASIDPEATAFLNTLALPGLTLTPPAGLTINRFGTGGWQLPITIPKGSSAVVSFGVSIPLASTTQQDPSEMSLLVAYAEDQASVTPEPDEPPTFDMNMPVATAGSSYTVSASGPSGSEFKWDFGDGTIKNGISASHTYQSPGTYTVTVYNTNVDGVTQKNTTQVQVIPEIQDVVKRRAVDDSMTVEFDLGDPIPGLDYQIDYGDGTTGNTSKSSHTYAKIGSYDYTVTIRDTRGLNSTPTLRAQAVPDAPIIYKQKSFVTLWRKAPQAEFTFTTTSGQGVNVAKLTYPAGTTQVSFDAGGSRDVNKEASNLTYSWDFGNGTQATGAQVNMTYTRSGTYLVSLKVTNRWGISSTRRQFIFVRDPAVDWRMFARYSAPTAAVSQIEQLHSDIQMNPDDPGSITKQLVLQGFIAENPIPYVMTTEANVFAGAHYSTLGDGSRLTSTCLEYKMFKNQSEVYPNLSKDSGGNCPSISYNSTTVYKFPAQQTNNLQVRTSKGLYYSYFNVFKTLSVPKVYVSVLPDDFLPGEQASPILKEHYTTSADGKKTYVIRVLFRESEVVGGILNFKIPVLAVNANGEMLTNLNGIFNGRFTSPNFISSSTEDSIMVAGKAYLKVSLLGLTFDASGQEIDLSEVQMMEGSTPCAITDSRPNSVASQFELRGCTVVQTTTDFPTQRAPTDIVEFGAELQKLYTMGTRVFSAKQANALKALRIYSQMGHVVAHAFVEWTAPFALWEEKQEDLQKATDALVVDGKISALEYGKLTFMNLAMWASNIPAGPLKPPSYAAVAQMSRNSLGTTASALESIVEPSAVRGMKTSEVNARLQTMVGKITVLIQECGQNCVNTTDDYLKYIILDTKQFKDTILAVEAQLKKQQFDDLDYMFKLSVALTEVGCPNKTMGFIKLGSPAGSPFLCREAYFKLAKKYIDEVDSKGVPLKGFYYDKNGNPVLDTTGNPVTYPWRGSLQRHHTFQQAWGSRCLLKGGLGLLANDDRGYIANEYNPENAPSISLETNASSNRAWGVRQNPGTTQTTSGHLPHSEISAMQTTRNSRGFAGQCTLSDLQAVLKVSIKDLINVGVHKQPGGDRWDIIKCVAIQNYKMLVSLGLKPGLAFTAVDINGDTTYAFEPDGAGGLKVNETYERTANCGQFY